MDMGVWRVCRVTPNELAKLDKRRRVGFALVA